MHVSKNKSVASLWLSTAYNNTNDSTVGIPRSYILEYSKSHNIELVTNPDLRFDPELVSNTAEFSNSNEDYKNTDFFTLLTYRIPEYHTQGEDEVFIDNFIINGVDADPEDFGDFRGIGEGQMMRMRMKKVDMFIPKELSKNNFPI